MTVAQIKKHIISGVQLLPDTNIWNRPIVDLSIHASSAGWVRAAGNIPLHVKVGPLSSGWSIPYNLVTNATPTYPVIWDNPPGAGPGPFPIPANPLIEEPLVSGSDRHLLCLNTDTGVLYEMTGTYVDGTGHVIFPVEATSGAVWDLSSNTLPPDGMYTGDAAGLPVTPGLLCYDEIVSGSITHALRCSFPFTDTSYVWPAKHTDGINAGMPPEGARLRLKSSVDISNYSVTNQIILTALKQYGLFIADSGGPGGGAGVILLYGPPDDRWNANDINVINNGTTGTIFLSQFDFVDQSSIMVSSSSAQAQGLRAFNLFGI